MSTTFPVPVDYDWLLMVDATIEAVYREELQREVDPSGRASALLLALRGSTVDDLRGWIRNSPEWHAKHDAQPLPPIPSREGVCGVRTHFQGLTYHTREFGDFPCFAWELLEPDDRASVLAQHRAVGDTHVTANLTGSYREPQASAYPARLREGHDWTNDLPGIKALVREAIVAGFYVDFSLGGDGRSKPKNTDGSYPYNDPVGSTYGYEWLIDNLERILRAFQDGEDLTPYMIFRPGYDGVFYGWGGDSGPDLQPQRVLDFGAKFRSILPNGYLAIEHDTGHIPVGEGGAEFSRGMQNFDAIYSEFSNWPDTGDAVWQIAGRLLGPEYRRPADQPSGDDPNPPFYLAPGTPRGPYVAVAFEYGKFPESRGNFTEADGDRARAYYQGLGYRYWG